MRKLGVITACAAAAACGFAAFDSEALTIKEVLAMNNDVTVRVSDESRETSIIAAGTELEVGDLLYGVIRFEAIGPSFPANASEENIKTGSNSRLGAVFMTEVTSKTNIPQVSPDFHTFTFGPAAPATLAATFGVAAADVQAGAIALLFELPPSGTEINVDQSIPATIADIVAGERWGTFGFGGDPDEGWYANADTDDVAALLSNGAFDIAFEAYLSSLADPNDAIAEISDDVEFYDQLFATNPFTGGGVQVAVSNGTATRRLDLATYLADTTQWPIQDKANFYIRIHQDLPVPEPTTAGLAVLGLAGLAGMRRRRNA